MKYSLKNSLTTMLMIMFISSSAYAAWDPNDEKKAQETVAAFKKKDADMEAFFTKAQGYVVYPSIGKGGMGIGGAHGSGVAYEGGKAIGNSKLSQISFGFQFGGQVYSEIVFFQNSTTMDKFKEGKFKFSAQASAVAVNAGVGAKTDFKNGIAIFTMAKGGLMYEASVAGQKLSFKPK